MSAYVRPPIPAGHWADAEGQAIVYGERWGADGPPDDSYSRTSNLERFAPLHDVADALVAWLEREFDVGVENDAEAMRRAADRGVTPVRAVRVTPASALSAPVTFVYTAFPGLVVEAGALFQMPAPVCGCDACDDAFDTVAADVEELVLAVAAGSFAERADAGGVETLISAVDGSGSRSQSGGLDGIPSERLAAARGRLARLDEADGPRLTRIGSGAQGSLAAWHPWPRRS